jgi:hypothetical protein
MDFATSVPYVLAKLSATPVAESLFNFFNEDASFSPII